MAETSHKDLVKDHKLQQDHKRELDHKHKWALGEEQVSPGHSSRRPAKQSSIGYSRPVRREVEFQQNKAAQTANISRKYETRLRSDASPSDSSAEEDVREASAAPEPDAGYTYSFDAPRGPGKGSQILGMALAKAVEKFETKATDKLIREEYEVVGKDKVDAHISYTDNEEDFEIV